MDDQLVSLTKGKEFKSAQGLKLPKINVPQKILEETKKGLLSFSQKGEFFEGIVYWAGKERSEGFEVTEVILPKAVVTPVSFRVTSFENARIMTCLVKRGLQLIAQVHSHPNRLGVEHNLDEEEMGFMPYDGFFSIVVKNYAKEGLLPLVEKTGIYIYGKNGFAKLTKDQAENTFNVIHSSS